MTGDSIFSDRRQAGLYLAAEVMESLGLSLLFAVFGFLTINPPPQLVAALIGTFVIGSLTSWRIEVEVVQRHLGIGGGLRGWVHRYFEWHPLRQKLWWYHGTGEAFRASGLSSKKARVFGMVVEFLPFVVVYAVGFLWAA